MGGTDAPDVRAATKRLPLHKRLYYGGLATLGVGLVAAAAIYLFSPDDRPDPLDEIASGRVNEYNIERIGGMAAVYAARFNRWLAALWHGQELAYTVAVLAVVVALACFWLAWLIATSEPQAHEHGPDA